jgi:hypothetical protein
MEEAVSQQDGINAFYWKTEETSKAPDWNSKRQYLKRNLQNKSSTLAPR